MKRHVKIPTKVLARAKAAAATVAEAAEAAGAAGAAAKQPPKKPIPPPHQPRKTLAREKVIAALKKLHPMD